MSRLGWTGQLPILGLLAVFMSALVLVACGTSAPAQPAAEPMDMEAMRSVVKEAVADASKDAATRKDVDDAVAKAMADSAPLPSGMTAEEVAPIVQTAVSDAMSDTPTREDIALMVEQAVSNAMADGLKPDEIGPLVEKALAESRQSGMTPEEVESIVAQSIQRALAPGKLVVYSGRSKSLVDPIIQEFAEATGIDVNVKYANTSQLAATLMEEGDNSPADVFFAQDPGGLGSVEDLMVPLPDSVLQLAPEWARSSQGRWVGISGRARAVVYNTERLAEADLPDDMWGFTDPSWKGRIGWAPTNASFQTMVTAMRALWGEDRTRAWLEGIQANKPRVYPKNTPQVAAAAAGEIDVGFVNHYYLFRFLAEEGENFPARNYHPRGGGPGSIIMVAGAGILKTAENSDNAERFLSFLLSTVGQQYFASQTFEYPLIEGIKTPRVLVPYTEINAPEIPLTDLTDLAGTQDLLRETGVLP